MTRVKGMKKLRAAVAVKKQKLEHAAKASERQGADDLCEDMKSEAPVDTGDLRDGIQVEKTQKGYGVGPDSNDKDKALAQEYGTRYMKAQPYVSPAEERARQEFVRTATTKLKKAAR